MICFTINFKKNKKVNFFTYEQLMRLGKSSGCHQISERSFFIRGKQFPICARCTGVLIGKFMAYILFFLYTLPPKFYIMGCTVMFIDWFIQYIGLFTSTNLRRLITGIIGGYSLTTLFYIMIKTAI